MTDGKPSNAKDNPIAHALRLLPQQVVTPRRGKGSYTRKVKHKGQDDE